jgi:predicted Na+-dependent transporter
LAAAGGTGAGALLGPSRLLSLLTVLLTLHLFAVWSLFHIFQFLGYTKEEVVAATFTASHKTMAFGLPLTKVIFDGNPNLASYSVPLMMIGPLQLSLGSLMVPWFKSYISSSRSDKQEQKQTNNDVITEEQP